VNFTSRSPDITFVHSSSMTPPFGLTNMQLFEESAGRPQLFLDRSLEFFRLLASSLDAHEHVLGLTRGG